MAQIEIFSTLLSCLVNVQDPDIEKLSNASCVADVLEMTMKVRDRVAPHFLFKSPECCNVVDVSSSV